VVLPTTSGGVVRLVFSAERCPSVASTGMSMTPFAPARRDLASRRRREIEDLSATTQLDEEDTGSVWILGVVSFFNDIASEMLYPLLPIFITQVLGAPVAILGLIDGVAEGAAAGFKVLFGHWSDRLGEGDHLSSVATWLLQHQRSS